MIKDLYDMSKVNELTAEIDASNVPSEVKVFLKAAAMRHCVFSYDKIADYYAHASEDVKRLMEQSALVIIDFQQAIENGFVKLSNEMREQYIKEWHDK